MKKSPNCSSLLNIISSEIAVSCQEKITFAQFADLVLYHPQWGYYNSEKIKIGSQGDFFTSPSLGKDFGELLAEQFVEMWAILEYPAPFTLVEMGAGTGVLAGDILAYLTERYPDLVPVLEYTIVELSPSLIAQQQQSLEPWLDKIKITWKTLEEIESNSITGCCFANELVDAFPVHLVTIEQGKLREIYVTLEEGKFKEVTDEPSTSKLGEYFSLVEIECPRDTYPEGYRTEINLNALDWLGEVAAKLHRGYLLTIDYGYTAAKYYHPQRREGTLHCYYQHRRHHNPYVNLGQQDITTHVDFTALEKEGARLGLDKVGFTKQGMFLMALGLGDGLAALSSSKLDFQQVLKRRDALHQLINPTGLGGFGVLIQSKGLDPNHSLKGFNQLNN